MCVECNKNVVQCLLHFINLKTVPVLFWRCLFFLLRLSFLHLLLAAHSVVMCMMTDTDDNTMAATPIIDKLNGNICVAAATLFFFYIALFCCTFIFYFLFNSQSDLVKCAQEFHMQIKWHSHTHSFTHTHFVKILDVHMLVDWSFMSFTKVHTLNFEWKKDENNILFHASHSIWFIQKVL